MFVSMVMIVGLAACGEIETEEKQVDSAKMTDDEQAAEGTDEESADDSEAQQFNEEVVDNEHVKATLVSVEKIIDKDWDEERFEIKFEVENKRDETIEVQAREVSADGKMIDDAMIFMSQEISAGKLADAVLRIENFDGDLPEIEENLEMILHIFSWDDYDFENDIDVKIDFK